MDKTETRVWALNSGHVMQLWYIKAIISYGLSKRGLTK